MKKVWQYSILLGASVCMGLFVYNNNFKNKSVTPDDSTGESMYQTTMIEKPNDGSSPMDHSALDNIAYLMWNTANEKEFETTTRGQSTAAFTTIEIYGKRAVKDNKAITSSVSDGLVSMGEQRYFTDGKVLIRDKDKVNGFNTTWNQNEPTCITDKKYIERMGWLPFQTSGYIVCEETILETSEVVDNGDSTYTVSVKLNPEHDYAPFYYSREIKTNSNSKITPIFYNIEMTYTFNSSWQILQADVFEEYKVKTMGLEAVTKTNCSETFKYGNVQFGLSDMDYFSKYENMEPTGGDEEQEEAQDDILTMLTSALQTSDGSDANFDLNIVAGEREIPANLALNLNDIEHVIVKLKLGNIYLEYSDQIYLDINGLKLKVKDASLFELIDKITAALDKNQTANEEPSIDLKQIIADINNGTITKSEDGKEVNIASTLSLGDINATLNFNLGLENDSYILKNGSATVNTNEETLLVSMNPASTKIPNVDKEPFVSVSSFDFVIDDIIHIMDEKRLSSNIQFTYGDLLIEGIAKVDFVDQLKFDLDLNIKYQEINEKLNLKYASDTLYLEYEGIKLKIDQADLKTMLDKYLEKDINLDPSNLNVEEIVKTILNIDFDALIKDLSINDRNITLVLALQNLQENLLDLQLKFYENNGLNIEAIYDQFQVKLDVKDLTDSIIIDDSNYQNLAYIDFIVDGVLDIVDNKALASDFVLSYQDLLIKGDARVNFENTLMMDVNLNLVYGSIDEKLNIKYLNDAIYLDYEGLKLKLSVEDLNRLLDQYLDSNVTIDTSKFNVESIVKTILGLDFNALIKDLTLSENNMSLVLKLQELKEGLTDLQLSIKKDTSLSIDALYEALNAKIKLKDYQGRIIVDDSKYQNLAYLDFVVDGVLGIVNDKKFASNLTLTYENILVEGDVKADFVDKIKLEANLTFKIDTINENLTIKMIDDVIYLDYDGLALKISLDALQTILNKYLDKPIDFNAQNFDVKEIIATILELDFSSLIKDLTLENKNVVIVLALKEFASNLLDLQLTIKQETNLSIEALYDKFNVNLTLKDYEGEILVDPSNYQDISYIDFILDGVLGIVKEKKFDSNIKLFYQDLIVAGQVKVDFVDKIKLEANLNIKYQEINESLVIRLVNDYFYLDYEGLALKISSKDLETLINKFAKEPISFTQENLDVEQIIKTILELDLKELIKEVNFKENEANMLLALSVLAENLQDLKLRITKDTSLNIEAIYDNLTAQVEIFDLNTIISVDDSKYQNLGYIDFIVDGVLGIIDDKKLDSKVTFTYQDLSIVGQMKVDFNASIKLEANLNILYKELNEVLTIKMIDDVIYLDYEGLALKISLMDLETILNKYLDKPVNLTENNFSLKEMIKTLLSLDFNSFIKDLKLADKNVSLVLALEKLADNLLDLQLSIKKNINLNIEALYDAFKIDVELFTLTSDIVVDPSNYQDLAYLDFILDGIFGIVNDKQFATDVTLSYGELEVLGHAKVDFVDTFKFEANLTFKYQDLLENLVVKVLNDTVYLDYEGIALKVSFADLETLLSKYLNKDVNITNNSFNLENIITTILALDFNSLIKDLKVDQNDVTITLVLSQLAENLLDLKLRISKDMNLTIEALYEKLNVKVELLDFTGDIIVDETKYQDLVYLDFILEGVLGIVNDKKLASNVSLVYQDLKVLGEVKVDFVDTLKLEAKLNIGYKTANENLVIKYLNENIYLDYEGLALKINQDDLVTLINNHSNQNIDLSTPLDIKQMVVTILSLDFSTFIKELEIKENEVKIIASLKELAENLLDLQIAIKNGTNISIEALYDALLVNMELVDFTGDIIIDETKYQNIAYLDFILEGILGIVDNKKLSSTIALNVQDLNLSGQVFIDFVDTLKFKLELNVLSTRYELDENIVLNYIDGTFFIDYNDHHLKLLEADLKRLIQEIDPSISLDEKVDVNNLLVDFLNLDLDKIISYLEIKENELSAQLDLSSLIKDLKDVQLSIKKAVGGLDVSLNVYDLMLGVNFDSNFIIDVEEASYLDLSKYVDLTSTLISLIGKESIHISGSEMMLNVKNGNQDIQIKMDVNLDLILVGSKYEVEGMIKLELLDVTFDLNFYLDSNNILYVNVINQTVSIDLNKESLDAFVTELTNRINELQVNPIEVASETATNNNDKMIKDLITLINNITFKEGSLEVRLDYLLNEVTKLAIIFSKIESENSLIFDIDLSYGNIVNGQLPIKVGKSLVKEASFLTKYEVNVTTDDLLHLVSIIVNTIKQNYFHFDIATTYTENGVMLADISGVVELRINSFPNTQNNTKLSFDLLIDLWAQEYDTKGQFLQKHHVKVTYLSSEKLNANDGILYAMYGNGQYQNNPTDYLRVKSSEKGVVALYDSLMDLMNSDALKNVLDFILKYLEVFTNPSKSVMDINRILNPIIFSQDRMDIKVPGTLINSHLKENIEIGVSTHNDLISQLDIKNLYLNYVDDNTFTRFDGLKLSLYHPQNELDPTYEEKLQIEEPTDKERYSYDISNMHYLIESLNNTAEQLNYEIDGNVSLSILGGLINPVVGLNAKISRENDSLRIHAHLYVPKVITVIYGTISEKGVDFYYQDEYVYIHRQDTNGEQRKIKLHYSSFLDDIAYWMMKYAIGVPDKIYDMMVGEGGTSSVPFVDASKCVTNVNFTEYSYGLGLDLRIITGNDMVGILNATLNSIDVSTNQLDESGNPISKKMLTSITNFSVKLVKDVININSSLIKVKNFTSEGVLPVDLTTYENFINSNASMEADRYYDLSNGKWIPGRKIDHAIIFQMGYLNNIEVRYNEFDKVTLPSVPSIITNDDFFGTHYYKFAGFYMDEAYIAPYNLEIMPAHNVKVYAKWDEVTVNISLNETTYNKEQLYVTYQGATLEDLYTLFEPVKVGDDLYAVTSFLLDGEPYLGNIAYEDITLEPVWTKVIYKASIAGQEIELDVTSEIPLVNEGKYMILLDDIYYVIDSSMITPKFLYKNYIRAFDENYKIEILNFTKEMASYQYVGISVDSRFNNKPYIALLVRNGSKVTSSMLPNSTYGDYEINAWTTGDKNYYLPLNMDLVVDQDIELNSYISVKKEYFTYKGNSITGFNDKFVTNTNSIKTLILPIFSEVDTRIETIAKSAFDTKNTFDTLVIPDGYKTIEALAFHNSNSLKHIYVADSVSSIYQDAFMMNYNNNYPNILSYASTVRFYHSSNASFNFDAHTLTACYYVSSPRYYGVNYSGLSIFGGGNFASCIQGFDGNMLLLNQHLVANL